MDKFLKVYLFPCFFGFTIILLERILGDFSNELVIGIIKGVLFITALLIFQNNLESYRKAKK